MKHILLFFGLGLSYVASCQIPGYVSPDGLVGWWPFNGNANDDSGNGNDGLVEGAVLSTDRFNEELAAYQFFGGMERILIPNALLPAALTSFSVSVWVQPETGGGIDVLSDRSSNSYNYKYRLAVGVPPLGANDFSFSGQLNNITSQVTASGVTTEWMHLVGVSDVSTDQMRLYKDGILIGSSTLGIQYPSQETATTIGANYAPTGGDNSIYGKIDDIGFWNRALTTEEIEGLHSLTTGLSDHNNEPFAPSIHPNPNNGDQLFINLGTLSDDVGTIAIDIHDLSGKCIRSSAIRSPYSDGRSIDVSEISAGIYTVNITAGDNKYSQRLVLQP